VTYTWTAPTTGSAVAYYLVEVSNDGGANWTVAGTTLDLTYTFTDFQNFDTYIVRVAGVDAQGRQGPYSVPSDPYTPDLGPPGAPGVPTANG
jgi:hypothetical protein